MMLIDKFYRPTKRDMRERHQSTAFSEATVTRLKIYIRALLAIIDRIEAENGSELQDLLGGLQEVKSRWEDIEPESHSHTCNTST